MLAAGVDPLAHGGVPPFDLSPDPGRHRRRQPARLPVARPRRRARPAARPGHRRRASGSSPRATSRLALVSLAVLLVVTRVHRGRQSAWRDRWTCSSSRSRFVVILLGAELFTNGIEWFGRKLELAEGAVGSVLAAVGTALPETMIPIIAIAFGGGGEATDAVGVGAILGAPFMLSTLAMFVTGVGVIAFRARRATRHPDGRRHRGARRTTSATSSIAYAIAIGAAFLPPRAWQSLKSSSRSC